MGRRKGLGLASIWLFLPSRRASRSSLESLDCILEAHQLYKKAGEGGHVPAMLAYADMLDRGMKNFEAGNGASQVAPTLEERRECVAWLRRAAQAGEASAALRLGKRLVSGWRNPQGHRASSPLLATTVKEEAAGDAAEGLIWLEKSAEAGSDEAMHCLARAYQYALGPVSMDDSKAIRWCRRLASSSPEARLNLHHLLLRHPELRTQADDVWLTDMPSSHARSASLADVSSVVLAHPRANDVVGHVMLQLVDSGHIQAGRSLAEYLLARDPLDVVGNNAMALIYLRRGLSLPRLPAAVVHVAESYLRRATKYDDPATCANLAACAEYSKWMR